MFTVKSRVYGKAADGRTILVYTPGMTITDDAARAAGLLKGKPKNEAEPTAKGLIVEDGEPKPDETPARPRLSRMNLAELRATCEAEGIDSGDANLRDEYIAAIEAARAAAAAAGDDRDGEDGEGDLDVHGEDRGGRP